MGIFVCPLTTGGGGERGMGYVVVSAALWLGVKELKPTTTIDASERRRNNLLEKHWILSGLIQSLSD